MLPSERREKIVEIVSNRGETSVETLADELDVSGSTIRRDLTELSSEDVLERTYGGAAPKHRVHAEKAYRRRTVKHLDEKSLIAEQAVEEIHPDEVVFFDSGTTTFQIAKKAPADGSFSAVTNSPLQALELGQGDGRVTLTGGRYREQTKVLVGPEAESFLQKSNFDLAFLGTSGIDRSGALSVPNEDEAYIKELVIENSRRVVLTAVTSKLGEQYFREFGHLSDVDLFITDGVVDSAFRDLLERSNVDIVEALDDRSS